MTYAKTLTQLSLLAASALGLFVFSGCLLASGPSKQDLGDHCIDNSDCGDGAKCLFEPSQYDYTDYTAGDTVCTAVSVVAPRLAGQSCQVNEDCVAGFGCWGNTANTYTICRPLVAQCDATTANNCGLFSCNLEYSYCNTSCTTDAECNTGYARCNYVSGTSTKSCLVSSY